MLYAYLNPFSELMKITVSSLRSRNLHCVISLLKVDSRRPRVIEVLAGCSTPACFSKLLNSEMIPSFAFFSKFQSAEIVVHH